jgi:hypothetical protein
MPLPAPLRAQLDAELAAFIAAVAPIQESLLNVDAGAFGPRYAQLPLTHDLPPGQDEAPRTDRKPPHRAIGWVEVKARGYLPPAKMRLSVEMHEHITPLRGSGGVTYTPGCYARARARAAGPPDEIYFRIAHVTGFDPGFDSGGWSLETDMGL